MDFQPSSPSRTIQVVIIVVFIQTPSFVLIKEKTRSFLVQLDPSPPSDDILDGYLVNLILHFQQSMQAVEF